MSTTVANTVANMGNTVNNAAKTFKETTAKNDNVVKTVRKRASNNLQDRDVLEVAEELSNNLEETDLEVVQKAKEGREFRVQESVNLLKEMANNREMTCRSFNGVQCTSNRDQKFGKLLGDTVQIGSANHPVVEARAPNMLDIPNKAGCNADNSVELDFDGRNGLDINMCANVDEVKAEQVDLDLGVGNNAQQVLAVGTVVIVV